MFLSKYHTDLRLLQWFSVHSSYHLLSFVFLLIPEAAIIWMLVWIHELINACKYIKNWKTNSKFNSQCITLHVKTAPTNMNHIILYHAAVKQCWTEKNAANCSIHFRMSMKVVRKKIICILISKLKFSIHLSLFTNIRNNNYTLTNRML